jgi:hypothetical protein
MLQYKIPQIKLISSTIVKNTEMKVVKYQVETCTILCSFFPLQIDRIAYL